MEILKAIDIVKTYNTGLHPVEVLKDIDLTVKEKEFMAITGKSGSGKTTLMNILGCLDTPTSGQYLINGTDVSHMDADQLAHIRNKKIGFVFQKFNLLQDMTAVENVSLPQLYAGKSEKEALVHSTKLLEMVHLGHRLNHFPTELSGGEQQRVAIARALANSPSIILADEPTGNLDSATGEKVLQMFKDLNKQKDVTIIIITHDQHVAEETNRMVRLVDGKIVEDKKIR
ncbi:ABC transporter ATP-binding protein [Candidatus Dependentiae bacterium]